MNIRNNYIRIRTEVDTKKKCRILIILLLLIYKMTTELIYNGRKFYETKLDMKCLKLNNATCIYIFNIYT